MTSGRKPSPKQADAAALTEVPSPPKWLSDSARAEWRRVAPVLVERRVLAVTDLGVLAAWCAAMGDIRDIRERIAEEGMVVDGKRHPLLLQLNAAMGQVKALGLELGLSPTARAKVGASPEEQVDDLSALDL